MFVPDTVRLTTPNVFVLGLYVNPVSVSSPCVPVAPSTNTGNTVSSVELFAVIVEAVAKEAVPVKLPVIAPVTPNVPLISALPLISIVVALISISVSDTKSRTPSAD